MLQNTDDKNTVNVVKLQAVLQKKSSHAVIIFASMRYGAAENSMEDLKKEAAKKSFYGKNGSYFEEYFFPDSSNQDSCSKEKVSLHNLCSILRVSGLDDSEKIVALNDPCIAAFESHAKSVHQSA